MPVVGIRELKINASAILRKVRDEREEYVITFHGKPVGILVPIDGEEVEEKTVEAAREVTQVTLTEEMQQMLTKQRAQRRQVRAEAQSAPGKPPTREKDSAAGRKRAEKPRPARPRRTGRIRGRGLR